MGWWDNPLELLSQGPFLMFCTFNQELTRTLREDPELDNITKRVSDFETYTCIPNNRVALIVFISVLHKLGSRLQNKDRS